MNNPEERSCGNCNRKENIECNGNWSECTNLGGAESYKYWQPKCQEAWPVCLAPAEKPKCADVPIVINCIHHKGHGICDNGLKNCSVEIATCCTHRQDTPKCADVPIVVKCCKCKNDFNGGERNICSYMGVVTVMYDDCIEGMKPYLRQDTPTQGTADVDSEIYEKLAGIFWYCNGGCKDKDNCTTSRPCEKLDSLKDNLDAMYRRKFAKQIRKQVCDEVRVKLIGMGYKLSKSMHDEIGGVYAKEDIDKILDEVEKGSK